MMPRKPTADPMQGARELVDRHAAPPPDAPEPPPDTACVDVPSDMFPVVREAASLLREGDNL